MPRFYANYKISHDFLCTYQIILCCIKTAKCPCTQVTAVKLFQVAGDHDGHLSNSSAAGGVWVYEIGSSLHSMYSIEE
jgi:hypothetical protein